MKLVIHDYAGHGFIAELSRELASRGHLVMHVFGAHNPTPKGFVERLSSDPEGLSFHPINLCDPFRKYSFLKRWQQEREYGRLLAQFVIDIHPDVVISAQAPLDAEWFLDRTCALTGIPRVHWLQDLIGVASHNILRKKMSILGRWIGLYYIAMERRLLRRASLIFSISEDFKPLLLEWGISSEMVYVIPNWPVLDQLPVLEKDNNWSQEHGLHDRFVFLYTGSLGFKHNPELLLALAQDHENNQQVKVVVVSEGPGAEWLKKQILEKSIKNLLILPYQPFGRYAEVLASGDVLVGILEADAGAYSVPSKILSYLCAQRPILLAIPKENKAARIVSDQKAGLVLAPDSLRKFLDAGLELLRDRALRETLAKNGRRYAEEQFDIHGIGFVFEQYILNLLNHQDSESD